VVRRRRICARRFAVVALRAVTGVRRLAEQVFRAGSSSTIDWQDGDAFLRARHAAESIVTRVGLPWDGADTKGAEDLLLPGIMDEPAAEWEEGGEGAEEAAQEAQIRAGSLFVKSRLELCVTLAQAEPEAYLRAMLDAYRGLAFTFAADADADADAATPQDPTTATTERIAGGLVAAIANTVVFVARLRGLRPAIEMLSAASGGRDEMTDALRQLHEVVLRCTVASEPALPSATALNCIREWRSKYGGDKTAHLLPLALEAHDPAKLTTTQEWAELISLGDFELLRAALLVLMRPMAKGGIRITLPAWANSRIQSDVDGAMVSADEAIREHNLEQRGRHFVLVEPVELLVLLHRTSSSAIPGARLLKAIQSCLEWDAIGESVVRDALDRLSQVAPVPLPFLRTTILAIKRFHTKAMKDFVAYVLLTRLVTPEHKVWSKKNLWSGFLMVCDLLVDAEGVPRAPAPALLRLPTEALHQALLQRPGWRQGLSTFALGEWDQRESKLNVGLMEVLGITPEEAESTRQAVKVHAESELDTL